MPGVLGAVQLRTGTVLRSGMERPEGLSGWVELVVAACAYCDSRGRPVPGLVIVAQSSATTPYVALPDGIEPESMQDVLSTRSVWQTSVSLPLPTQVSGPRL